MMEDHDKQNMELRVKHSKKKPTYIASCNFIGSIVALFDAD